MIKFLNEFFDNPFNVLKTLIVSGAIISFLCFNFHHLFPIQHSYAQQQQTVKHAVNVRKSNNEVFGTWRGKTLPLSTAEVEIVEITEAKFREISDKGFNIGAKFRFKKNPTTGEIEEQPDLRFVLIADPDTVLIDLGGQKPTITLTMVDSSAFNGSIKIKISDKKIKLDFVNGVASVKVKVTEPKNILLIEGDTFRMQSPLFIEVADTEF